MGDNSFLFLPLSVLATLAGRMPAAIMAYGIALIVSCKAGAIEPVGLLGLGLTAGSLWFGNTGPKTMRFVLKAAAIALVLLLSDHRWPGFFNPVIFDHRRFSPDSVPYTMYINFDKVSAGLLVYVFCLRGRLARLSLGLSFRLVSKVLFVTVGLLMPLALAVSYVRFDAKWPVESLLWACGNLTLVVFAEECIYRGLLFGSLKPLARPWFAIIVSSIAFGLSHYHGGTVYILFATVAGLFYGYTYWRTGRIGSSMLVHFGLNAIHFFLFSYPALASH